MQWLLSAFASWAKMLTQSHFSEFCRAFTDLHAKHVVLCPRGDVLMGLSTGEVFLHSVQIKMVILQRLLCNQQFGSISIIIGACTVNRVTPCENCWGHGLAWLIMERDNYIKCRWFSQNTNLVSNKGRGLMHTDCLSHKVMANHEFQLLPKENHYADLGFKL